MTFIGIYSFISYSWQIQHLTLAGFHPCKPRRAEYSQRRPREGLTSDSALRCQKLVVVVHATGPGWKVKAALFAQKTATLQIGEMCYNVGEFMDKMSVVPYQSQEGMQFRQCLWGVPILQSLNLSRVRR